MRKLTGKQIALIVIAIIITPAIIYFLYGLVRNAIGVHYLVVAYSDFALQQSGFDMAGITYPTAYECYISYSLYFSAGIIGAILLIGLWLLLIILSLLAFKNHERLSQSVIKVLSKIQLLSILIIAICPVFILAFIGIDISSVLYNSAIFHASLPIDITLNFALTTVGISLVLFFLYAIVAWLCVSRYKQDKALRQSTNALSYKA